MVTPGGAFAPIQVVRPTPELAQRGLRCLIDGPERTLGARRPARVEEQVAQFLSYAGAIQLDPMRMVVALQEGRVVGMTLWVPSPGRTAVMFLPPLVDYPEIQSATQATMVAVIEDVRAAGMVMVQVMADTRDAVTAAACEHVGMFRLAQLNYMERQPPAIPPAVQLSQGLRLDSYSEATHDAFRRAILASYEGTLDCPALSGMRDIIDVLAGHRAVGQFDPNLWSVVMDGMTPIGCLLLSEIPARNGLDIVYLGLAPAGRGRGIGRALMQRTLAIGSRRAFDVMSLAVDANNAPALKLYKRFGYSQVAQRIAYIGNLT